MISVRASPFLLRSTMLSVRVLCSRQGLFSPLPLCLINNNNDEEEEEGAK